MYSSCKNMNLPVYKSSSVNFIFVTIQDDRQIDYATLNREQYCEGAVKQLKTVLTKPISARRWDPTVTTDCNDISADVKKANPLFKLLSTLYWCFCSLKLWILWFPSLCCLTVHVGHRNTPPTHPTPHVLFPLLKSVCDVQCSPCNLTSYCSSNTFSLKRCLLKTSREKCLKVLSVHTGI